MNSTHKAFYRNLRANFLADLVFRVLGCDSRALSGLRGDHVEPRYSDISQRTPDPAHILSTSDPRRQWVTM